MSLSPVLIDSVMEKTDCICGVPYCRDIIGSIHHIVPKSKRGNDAQVNLIGLCHEHHYQCHNMAGGQELMETLAKRWVINKGLSLDDCYKPLKQIAGECGGRMPLFKERL